MFADKVKIKVTGGRGGAGSASFRREKYVPKGGPDGGDGGHGGDVVFVADKHLKTLLDFVHRPSHEAQPGQPGRGRKKYGRDGEDLILRVPLGTVIYQGQNLLADMLQHGQEIVVAKGGRGGRGNLHFKSSVRQAPRIAELGEPPEEVELELQLKLIADVGLIGFPNAGKSTLLARMTRANPKIGNYPFTTLHPNLGVTTYDSQEIVFADIPGLIEGSHTGKGLGHEFLRHIERTRVMIHVVDPLGYADHTPKEAIKIINKELSSYSKKLGKKPQVIVVNKSDLAEAKEIYKSIKRSFRSKTVLLASGVSGEGMDDVIREAMQMLNESPVQEEIAIQKPLHVKLEPDFWVAKEDDVYYVRGKKVETLISMTNFDLPEAVQRTQHILKKMGIERELLIRGAVEGNLVKIGHIEFTFEPQIDIASGEAIRRRKELVKPV